MLNPRSRSVRKALLGALLGCFVTGLELLGPPSAYSAPLTNEIRIVELQGEVEVSPAGATTWVLTRTNQVLHPFDRVRTGPNSRVALRWSDQSVVPFGASTELEILPPDRPGDQVGLHLIRGVLSFFHRDEPGRIRVITRGAVAGVEGTEFVLAVDEVNGRERTVLSVIDGRVRFGNERASLVLTNGQQAVAETGEAPVRTAGFIANNLLQWCFYYPAVLDLADLPLTSQEQTLLHDSLEAYQAGDLPGALAKYPSARQPASDAERVYYAALLLSVGEAGQAEGALASLSAGTDSSRLQRLAQALRLLIAAVKREPLPAANSTPQLTTELLASSYYEQSRALPGVSLKWALTMAQTAANSSPGFSFAWGRVAELEFSFGNTESALAALDRSLRLASRNPQALALKGFLLAAQHRTRESLSWFDQALAVDSALGNAWLGRGLCRIQLDDPSGGREDLLIAAALEPRRAALRSYLGKAYGDAGDVRRATQELQMAKTLDPNDPTAWLYSALLYQQHNRINEAIQSLEQSQRLNDNRSVYRSQLLLDQDQAVRSANLAAVYRDAGMFDVAVREASRSVNFDYANYSAHLFLANSYNELRDPNLINLRYETPAQTEYLLANLLAPANAGPLSPTISQQEYSRLFERERLGVVSSTEYLSRGAWTQSGAQFGAFNKFSYALEAFYRSDPGQRINNDTEQRLLSFVLKPQLTPRDTLYLQIQHYESESGDVRSHYRNDLPNTKVRVKEAQEPLLGLGYHHEWSPGVHTLVLLARLDDTFSLTNPAAPTLLVGRPDLAAHPGETWLSGVTGLNMHEHNVGEVEMYSGEIQQIWQGPAHNTILGGRLQYGNFDNANLQNVPSALAIAFAVPAAQQDVSTLFKRLSFYGYHQWQILDSLQLIGGMVYDRITFPRNIFTTPVSADEETREAVLPKAGLIWTPTEDLAVRFGYTRSLSGASLEQSYRLEPSQVAGFVQSFRSIIPESVAGPSVAARFETFGLSVEQKFPTGTYLGLAGELLNSEDHRTVGAFDYLVDQFDVAIPSGLRQELDFQERSLLFTVNQLIGNDWSLGSQYRVSQAILDDDFLDVSDGIVLTRFQPRHHQEAILHQVSLFAIYNGPCGCFAKQEAVWYGQSNSDYTPTLPGDEFWQINSFIGYRFARRKAEIALGLLNLTDQDYRLNPLNTYNELPRRRTLAVRLQCNF